MLEKGGWGVGMEDEIQQKRERRKGKKWEGNIHIERKRESEGGGKKIRFVSRYGLVLVHLSTALHQIETG
jgi:hypothetical protein